MVWGPLHGECQEFHEICIQDKVVTPKAMHGPAHTFYTPQYLHHQNTNTDFNTPIPLHHTFHPLSFQEALGNVHTNTQSFLFTNPTGVLPVCHWASNGQFTLCGTSSVLLPSRVCSFRAVMVHLACLACTTVQRWVPSVGVMRKSQFWWRTHECPVCWFFTSRKRHLP